MHVGEGVCDLCQRSEEMLSVRWHKMLKLAMFIKEKKAGQLLGESDCK